MCFGACKSVHTGAEGIQYLPASECIRKIGIDEVKIDVPDLPNGEIRKISLRIMFLNE
jgi:hypothetical protein